MVNWIRFSQTCVWLVVRFYLLLTRSKIEVQFDRDDLKKDVGIVLAANHQHRLDPFIVCTALPFHLLRVVYPIYFMGYWQFFRHWFLRWPLLSFGAFPTKPYRNLDYGLPYSLAVLANHGTVFIFPEGKRVRSEPVKAHHGVEVLASTPGVEVILCHIQWRQPAIKGVEIKISKPKNYSGVPAQEILEDIYRLGAEQKM